jgi:hypothetical protein
MHLVECCHPTGFQSRGEAQQKRVKSTVLFFQQYSVKEAYCVYNSDECLEARNVSAYQPDQVLPRRP